MIRYLLISTQLLCFFSIACLGFSASAAKVDFEKEIAPILEMNCVSCHSGDEPEGDFNLTTKELATDSGSGEGLVAGEPDSSMIYTLTVVERTDEMLMPPLRTGGPLTKEQTELLRNWISEGAEWPADKTLVAKPKPAGNFVSADDFELIKKIHAKIVAQAEKEAGEAQNYAKVIPLTQVEFNMVAVPGGEFLMGSPEGEELRKEDEGPQTKVKVDPFWIGKCEVTWDEYEPFMITQVDRRKDGGRIDYDADKHTMVDAVSQPTPPYTEMSFGMGQHGYPAISMTQHAANKYCQWLSAQTGHFYRLPTEAEWEYACRAGTNTAYSFGDDPDLLKQYAWFYDNANEKYQKVGLKKPNPWGLHDMHGNVMEWTADQYTPDYFAKIQGHTDNPFIKPTTLYPRTVRGGGWDDDPDRLRSAARRGSDASWKIQDPQLPKSIWYHTDATQLGFRIVRPAKVPSPEEMYFYWNSARDVY
ncbi:SUMF1/EgtB/PvdO family nonheme iron enzyme [Blastopirellula sp. JC732]|uniref:SUMF1/EgtB/PvdO family nonheme iron enzyme n=1 Tax=Blastopirellula sediminis TaxID=2894196 RepID=A0A9X1MJ12_9BACT|nr:SUMF1/EgtB/PvdO family nonheme iron enzyme [Blastopirellula sediminis]MCC9604292.1 SUMF1/EgtB/PvdO family nonheme iron enzyme [Blastopirellula sediminis]MCC9626812.1 SUMF1/EgtB/PvdO family nonheme iron enzyme [Blastopirellula sediminis]